MQESFLHYLWQMQYFDKKDLRTVEGDTLEIFNPGHLNTNAGPDFANARIKIGSINWFGNVEVHTRSSEWLNHGHQQDPAYDNVILHLVWQHDAEISRTDSSHLPTLELRGRVDESLIRTYRRLISSSFAIPCQHSLRDIPEINMVSMVEKAFMIRLERKAKEAFSIYQQNGNNWEETCYQLLARNFGFKINGDPFFQLARALPVKIIHKQGDSVDQIEALLFGQAGFLDSSKGDAHYLKLRREFQLLSRKYALSKTKLSKSLWRFMRLRPANFPSLRLAQFAAIFHQRQNFFSNILHAETIKELTGLLSASPSNYWTNHYQFSKKSKNEVHELGQASIENIIINTVVPLWAAYGKATDDHRFLDRSIRLVQELPAEHNRITKTWEDLGISNKTSFDSQGLIELFNNFCQRKSCLDCSVGSLLMRPVK